MQCTGVWCWFWPGSFYIITLILITIEEISRLNRCVFGLAFIGGLWGFVGFLANGQNLVALAEGQTSVRLEILFAVSGQYRLDKICILTEMGRFRTCKPVGQNPNLLIKL